MPLGFELLNVFFEETHIQLCVPWSCPCSFSLVFTSLCTVSVFFYVFFYVPHQTKSKYGAPNNSLIAEREKTFWETVEHWIEWLLAGELRAGSLSSSIFWTVSLKLILYFSVCCSKVVMRFILLLDYSKNLTGYPKLINFSLRLLTVAITQQMYCLDTYIQVFKHLVQMHYMITQYIYTAP